MKISDEAVKSAGERPPIYEFAGLQLDPQGRRVEREGRSIPLYDRAFDALTLLVEGEGALISKESLLARLWPGVLVEENSVARVISDLRRALGDQADCVITVPRKGYRFGAEVRTRSRSAAVLEPGRRSLGVLPFVSPTGDEADRLLGFGLADALVFRLSKLSSLVVRPTSSAARCADRSDSPLDVGRMLNADAVICGAVRRSGEKVRVSVQLVDVNSAATLWAAKFDEPGADLFALEDKLSVRVADALALELTRGERPLHVPRPTGDGEAYDFYIRGRAWLSRRFGDTLRQAANCFRQAIDRDPNFALAHAGLAEAYTLISFASATVDPQPPRVMVPLAKSAAQRALALDERLGEAHGILGHIRYCYDWDWAKGEESIRRSLEINPANGNVRQYFAIALSSLGRHDEALEQIRMAQLLDPTEMVKNANLGFLLYRARRFDEAVDQLRITVAMDPTAVYPRFRFGLALEAAGRADEALSEYDTLFALPGAQMHALVGKGHLLAAQGRHEEARRILDRLTRMAGERYVSTYYFAEIHAALGERGAALDSLEAACEERPVMMISLRTNPKFDCLRDEPRFRALERRVGLSK